MSTLERKETVHVAKNLQQRLLKLEKQMNILIDFELRIEDILKGHMTKEQTIEVGKEIGKDILPQFYSLTGLNARAKNMNLR